MHSHSFVNILPILLVFIATAIAAPGPSITPRYPTKCFTSMVTRTTRGPRTTWSTMTTSCTSTSTVTSTITPSTTSTITDTTTETSTASTSTITATEITTVTSTETSVTTTVTTSTSIVEAVSTSTVPTSAGFVPVETTVPGASFEQGGSGVKRDLSVRDNVSVELAAPTRAFSPANPRGRGDVMCYEYHSRCSTTTTTTTITASTTTFSTTVTSTSTVTTTPEASTTITNTVSETTTTVSTETSTVSTVSTSFTATTSVYAACATSNQANYVNSFPVTGFFGNGNPQSTPATTEYDCCVSALLNPTGALWAFVLNSQFCLIATTATCAAGQASNGVGNSIQVTSNPANAPLYGLGNANCGRWDTLVTV